MTRLFITITAALALTLGSADGATTRSAKSSHSKTTETAEPETKANTHPDAGGIEIQPNEGEIGTGDELTITFPAAMVTPDKIDMADQEAPFVSAPAMEGTFLWKSETEGVFTIKKVVAGAKHRLTLRAGLTNAAGHAVKVPEWSAELTAKPYDVTSRFEEREKLGAQPQISLTSSYDLKLTEVAEHVYVQDRDSHARLPVDVVIWNDQEVPDSLELKEVQVQPRVPLPVGHTYDLVVNGLLDAASRRPLPYLKVIALGKTVPLAIEWLGAFAPDEIRIKFNDDIDPKEATAQNIRIEPEVANAKFMATGGDEVDITGDFDTSKQYRVFISPNLKGERGFGLSEESRWRATFHPPRPTLMFPASQVYLRAKPELQFSFYQENTPAVTWKVARIPLEKLPVVTARVREFERDAIDPVTGKSITDPRTGFNQQFQTELLVDGFKLPVVASGTTEASKGDKPELRQISAAMPSGEPASGVYLLEASAKLDDGRVIGNRSVISTSDLVLTQKRTMTKVVLRLTKMADGQSVAGINVRAVTDENIQLASAVTDAQGLAVFDRAKVFLDKKPQAHLFIADGPNGVAIQRAEGAAYQESGFGGAAQRKAHVEIVTDRNLYRPGQVVKMKGFVRENNGNGPTIPVALDAKWRVQANESDRVLGEGTAKISPYGGWEAEWTIPANAKLGQCQIRCKIDNQDYDGRTAFSIEEYRVPLFSAVVEAKREVGQTAHAHVTSSYFHGAPNVGARVHWKATFTIAVAEDEQKEGETPKTRLNRFPEVGPSVDIYAETTKTIEGDVKLDGHGFADLSCESPFKDNAAVGKTMVAWRADVTSVDGQTMTGGDNALLFSHDLRLGIGADQKAGDTTAIAVTLDAIDAERAQVNGVSVHVELFHVTTKVAKEQVAPFVFRYRNTDELTKVGTKEVKTPGEVVLPVSDTGRYIATAVATDRKTILVSDETFVSGEKPAELPVTSDTGFTIKHDAKEYLPGEKAALSLQAPFGGQAWVSVETDEILDTMLVSVPGNAGRIDLPIKKEYAPNATVSIYLVKPGGDKELPRERFASSSIRVRRPDRELKIEPHLANATVKPGESVRGEVKVSSDGKPLGDVDLAVFAVDDAVLKLGSWTLPNVFGGFYPDNPFSVRSDKSLSDYIERIMLPMLTEKGFVIGDGGDETPPNVTNVRKEFKTLAFWQGSLITGSDGKVSFDFVAPDNLTTYRIVAVGETKANQFGGDSETTVKVSKPLLINPALPRFLRHGDEVELRVSVQQNYADTDQVTVRCVADASVKVSGEPKIEQAVPKDAPTVFRFKAKIDDPNLTPAKIRFEAVSKANAQNNDGVELTLPVQPVSIVRKESIAGQFAGPQFDPHSKMSNDWKRGRGTFTTTISTSSYLPKMAGIPMILDYPHGCFEQISTKLLGYSFLANLLAYLPEVQAHDSDYRAILERGMRQFSDSLLTDGFLPYWPGGETPHNFVTCQAFWAVNESVNAGFEAPEGLRDKLAGALKKIINGQVPATPLEKAYAYFVLTQYSTETDLSAAAQELYLRRNKTDDEARAFLAIGLHRQDIMPREQEQLLKELDAPVKPRGFDPKSFTSMTRAEAIIALAYNTVAPQLWNAERKKRVRDRMLQLMDSSESLSTQENLWLLLAFKSMVAAENAVALNATDPPGKLSSNRCSAAWLDRKLADQLSINGLNQAALTFLMRAEFSIDDPETDRVDRGFRVERVIRNMSDAKRTGEANAPFKLGDQLLVTYRVMTRKKQNYVALEDTLPAGLEVVNPNLASVAKFYELPPESEGAHMLGLSHSEIRDKVTLLYFDEFEPGTGTYSVLARATAAGTFRWPATQVTPMYDSRFSGLSPSTLCVISGD